MENYTRVRAPSPELSSLLLRHGSVPLAMPKFRARIPKGKNRCKKRMRNNRKSIESNQKLNTD